MRSVQDLLDEANAQSLPDQGQEAVSQPREFLGRINTWDDFVGNPMAVERAKIAIEASEYSGTTLPNVLLYGNAGCGKTTLARIIAGQLNCKLFEITGSSLRNQMDLVALVWEIEKEQKQGRDVVVFIDEIHGMTKGTGLSEDIWLPLLEDFILHHSCGGKLLEKVGENTAWFVNPSPVRLSPVTWIGATTDPGMLHEAIRRRFPISITLHDYTIEDMRKIIIDYVRREGMFIELDAINIIASRSRFTPAIAIHHLLRQSTDIAILGSKDQVKKVITKEHAEKAMRLCEVGEYGLKPEDLSVLKALASVHPKGLGINTLSDMAGIARNICSEMVLPYLQRIELVKTTHKRFITDKGLEVLKGAK